jgi:hypothetical protein
VTETRSEEHDRLLKRTAELKDETAALSVRVTPFDPAEHRQLSADLRRHRDDLAKHRDRTVD